MCLGERRARSMRRKKHRQDMSRDELIQFGQKLEEQRKRRNARRRERRLWLKTAPREETFSMLYAGNGDDVPYAIIYEMPRDEPARYLLGRYGQKGRWDDPPGRPTPPFRASPPG